MLPFVYLLAVISQAPSSGDQARLQGVWSVEKVEQAGRAVPKTDPVHGRKFVIEGDRLYVQGEKGGRQSDGTFKLDPSKTPKQIDLTLGGKVLKGVYELDGDKLKWHVGGPTGGAERPKDFTTRDDKTSSRLVVLTRDQ